MGFGKRFTCFLSFYVCVCGGGGGRGGLEGSCHPVIINWPWFDRPLASKYLFFQQSPVWLKNSVIASLSVMYVYLKVVWIIADKV